MLRLYVLGSFRMEQDGERIPLPRGKLESLLAYLALHPQQHPREKIAALFWGDNTDENARRSLRVALTTLYKKVGHAYFLADRQTLQIHPDALLWVDAHEFRSRATRFLSADSPNLSELNLDLYQGDLLAELYDDWVLSPREEYRELYLATLLHAIEFLRAASDYPRAIEFANRVLGADPANERAHQHLMVCYSTLGDRTAALEQYEKCKQALGKELGIEPSSETLAVYESIKTKIGTGSTAARLTNLPRPLTSFVGRHDQSQEIMRLLRGVQAIVTLTGVGGSGKTRLAIQVGHQLVGEYADGIWWVDLAPLTDDSLVPPRLAHALGVQERTDQAWTETLLEFLRTKRMLLVIDNCEHLIAACAPLIETIAMQCPRVQILATSREALGIGGEHVWHIPTLAVPNAVGLAEWLLQYESIRLFVERATAANSYFSLTPQNVPAVVQICQRLDGMPLAIELAAARITTISPEQIAERLDNRFALLTSHSRTVPSRQQTLRATLDWSYDLLTETEAELLRQLAVFVGGFTLESLEAVAELHSNDSVLEVLSRLVDKSLVVVEQHETIRYRLLETIREYALEKLHGADESTPLRDRHLGHCLHFMEATEPRLFKAEQGLWMNRLELEHDNLRAALAWSLNSQHIDSGLRLASALLWFWYTHDYWSEGRHWYKQTLHRGGAASDSARAKALYSAAFLATFQNEYQEAETFGEAALALCRELDDARGMGWSLFTLGVAASDQNQLERAETLAQASLALLRQSGDKYEIGFATELLGEIARHRGDYSRARSFVEESLALHREVGNTFGIALELMSLGWVVLLRQDYQHARAFVQESLALWQALGYKRGVALDLWTLGGIERGLGNDALARAHLRQAVILLGQAGDRWLLAYCLEGLAGTAHAQGEFERAARLFGAAEALRQAIGAPLTPADRAEGEKHWQALQALLGDHAFDTAWAAGHALSQTQAVELALQNP